jgi:hypothetical protein
VVSVVRFRIALTALTTCAVLLTGPAVAGADDQISLRLVFDAARTVTPAVRANAVREAARIWSRYDVSLVSDDGEARCLPAGPGTVTVQIDVGRDTESRDVGLGAIRFASDGTPESTIVLHYDAVTRVATSAPFMGLHPALWPAGLREEIVARALGRALAHELGHYLLRSPHHANSGLMQARHTGSMLGDPSDRPFALTQIDRARLRLALADSRQTECPVNAVR